MELLRAFICLSNGYRYDTVTAWEHKFPEKIKQMLN